MKKISSKNLRIYVGIFVLIVGTQASQNSFGWGGATAPTGTPAVPFRADCSKCQIMIEEVKKYHRDAELFSSQLEKQNHEFKLLGPDATSKKVRMTTSMLVLTAKVEAAQNRGQTAEKTRLLHCKACH